MYKIEVKTMPRANILDPQGAAVKNSLARMGYNEVADVRIGKSIEIFFESKGKCDMSRVEAMAKRLLVNDVTEDLEIIVCKKDQ